VAVKRDTALRADLVAGLTAAAVVLPKTMAYASVAGLPVSGLGERLGRERLLFNARVAIARHQEMQAEDRVG
jgi:hypothetical protein